MGAGIRNELDTVLKPNKLQGALHIPRWDGEPYCLPNMSVESNGMCEKPVGAFPEGYADICPSCLEFREYVQSLTDDQREMGLGDIPIRAGEDYIAVRLEGNTLEEMAEQRGLDRCSIRQNVKRAERLLEEKDG